MDDLQRSGRPRRSGAMQAPPARTSGRATRTTGSTLKACRGTRRTSILCALENLGRWSLAWLEKSHQAHESFVLMVLVMAMKQRRARVVGDEIELHGAEARHVDGVLHDARGRLVAHLGDLEAVTMQVNRMVVAALVGHGQPVALAGLGAVQRIGVGPGLAVEGPAVVTAASARHLFESELDAPIRLRNRPSIAEDRVVPG